MTNETFEDENGGLIEVPNFLAPLDPSAQKEMRGLEAMEDHIQSAYAKIVQSNANDELKEVFDEGDLIVTPQMIRITPKKEIFHVTPIYSYLEYSFQNPIGFQPFIIEKTFDKTSDLAKRARCRDESVRKVPHPENPQEFRQYTEHINFVFMLHDHNDEIGDIPVVASYFRGEWKRGMSLKTLLSARKKFCNNICGIRLQASIGKHRNAKGNSWWGWDIANPDDGQGFVTDKAQFDLFCEIQKAVEEAYSSGTLDVDYDAGGEAEDTTSNKY